MIGRLSDRMYFFISLIFEGRPFWFQFSLMAFSAVLPGLIATLLPPEWPIFTCVTFACVIGFMITSGGIMVMLERVQRARILKTADAMKSLQSLTFRDFEFLVATVFFLEGYRVEHVGESGPDGGIDLKIHRKGKSWIVQCKHYRWQQIGVGMVRELAGVREKNKAVGAIFVTSGEFTNAAHREFDEDKSMELVTGGILLERIERLRSKFENDEAPETTAVDQFMKGVAEIIKTKPDFIAVPTCPKCQSPMNLRYSKKNSEHFWGCSEYESGNCKGMQKLTPQQVTTLDPTRGRGKAREAAHK